jgi:transposase-like protein
MNKEEIRKWIMKYSKLVKEIVDSLKVELSEKFHVDETMIKCDRKDKWFWEILDADTKFLVLLIYLEKEQ